jgi:Na+/glutamate symporter
MEQISVIPKIKLYVGGHLLCWKRTVPWVIRQWSMVRFITLYLSPLPTSTHLPFPSFLRYIIFGIIFANIIARRNKMSIDRSIVKRIQSNSGDMLIGV